MISLQCPELDRYHEESDALLERFDFSHFEASFQKLLEHTQEHFANEERLMQENRFYGLAEHQAEHRSILAEMSRFYAMALNGQMLFAKSYIKNGVKERLDLHIRNIDSQLAMFLKSQNKCVG